MHALKPAGTREREAVNEWLDKAAGLRAQIVPHVDPDRTATAMPFFDNWVAAVAGCGVSELYARSYDRAVALDVQGHERDWLAEQVKKNNERGIEALEQMRELLPAFREELAQLKDPADFGDVLTEIESELREGLAEYDMKGSDARQLMERIGESVELLRREGWRAMPDHIDGLLGELVDRRRSEDRGAVDNIAWWKAVIIAGWVGWWLTIMLICFVYGAVGVSCPPGWFVVWAVVSVIHFIAFLLFC